MRFAFIWQGLQCTFTRLLQGLNHSPTIRVAHAALAKELEMLKFPQEVTVGQSIRDVLRGGHFAEPLKRLRTLATTHPQSTGVEIPEEQKQGPRHKFICWGVRWICGRKTASDEMLQEIQWLPLPPNEEGVMCCARDLQDLGGHIFQDLVQ